MSDHELEKLAGELRRVKPAKLPEQFAARLLAAGPPAAPRPAAHSRSNPGVSDFLKVLRWLTPATAALVLTAIVVWRSERASTGPPTDAAPNTQSIQAADAPQTLKADDVKIDQELMASFDAVARLPSGEPVRFRCQTWMDQIALSDNTRGVFIENRTPRVQVVPVGFESY